MGQRQPWHRQPDESAKAYEAFRIYREMGPSRSISKAARKLNKSTMVLARWSTRWSWQERIQAWDDNQSEKHLVDEENARAEVSSLFWEGILEQMRNLVAAARRGGEIKPTEIARGIKDIMQSIALYDGRATNGQSLTVIQGENIQVNQFEAELLSEIGAALRILPKEWKVKVFAEIRRRREMLEGAGGEGSEAARTDK